LDDSSQEYVNTLGNYVADVVAKISRKSSFILQHRLVVGTSPFLFCRNGMSTTSPLRRFVRDINSTK
jgi:hypothetical protein